MKISNLLLLIIFVFLLSCSNNKKEESSSNTTDNSKQERNELLNNKVEEEKTNEELIQQESQKKLSDEELVNKAGELHMEAGGNPISVKDTLKLEKALAHLNKALEINRKNDAAYTNKVTILCTLGRYREALKVLKEATHIQENFAEGYSYQGFIYERLGKMDTARIMYRSAIEAYNKRLKKRDNINDKINRAFMLFFVKGKEAALKELNHIIKNNPDNKFAHNMKFAFENFDREEFIEQNLK